MQSKLLILSILLAAVNTEGIGPGITATTVSPSVLSKLANDIEAYDHSTLGTDTRIGALLGSVAAVATAFPAAVNVLESFRSELNFRPTDFIVDQLESPSAVVADFAAQVPTIAPFPAALAFISSVIGEAGYIGSVDLGYVAGTAPVATIGTVGTTIMTSASVSWSSSVPPPVFTGGAAKPARAGCSLLFGAVAAGAAVIEIAMV